MASEQHRTTGQDRLSSIRIHNEQNRAYPHGQWFTKCPTLHVANVKQVSTGLAHLTQ